MTAFNSHSPYEKLIFLTYKATVSVYVFRASSSGFPRNF